MGNAFLNRTVDGFLKIGAVGASKVAAEETYDCLKKGPSRFPFWKFSKDKLEDALRKICKEGVYWGTTAGVYVGMEYGVERMRGTKDWIAILLICWSSGEGPNCCFPIFCSRFLLGPNAIVCLDI
ncbi:outer envelope pore protein 16-1, chloroplastic isoform X8 [Elaeis guineensis]|uniref:outer envelope pore protein 16-1, chloroplastic isoform X8 n=1 Tax=Elaeis guineensis var. tenera TaxID=51953 RepID=UPI003C6D670E